MLQNLYNCIVPSVCCLCDENAGANIDLCNACRALLPVNSTGCYRCALPLQTSNSASAHAQNSDGRLLCGQCLSAPPPFHQAFVPFLYRPPIDFFARQLKFGANLNYARVAGHLMCEMAAQQLDASAMPDLLVPVPVHRSTLKTRGFNQAERISRLLSRYLDVPQQTLGITRIRHLRSQSGLTARQREQNIISAFDVSADLTGRNVAIVDDVVTTGATARSLARKIQTNGAASISLWALARTP